MENYTLDLGETVYSPPKNYYVSWKTYTSDLRRSYCCEGILDPRPVVPSFKNKLDK